MLAGPLGAMRRLALVLAVLLGAAGPAAAGPAAAAPVLTLDASLVWSEDAEGFGGFSGLEILSDGAALAAIGDRGVWVTAALERVDGRLSGIRMTGFGPLLAISGEALVGDEVDAEGLAVDASGAFYVSFEAFHRIRRFARLDAAPEAVPNHPAFPELQRNSALEALAIDASGALFAIPERSGALTRPFPVYRLQGGVWDRDLAVRRDGDFLISGADFGPDGALYVLERKFEWLRGFATRIRRFDVTPSGLANEVTLLESPFGALDNMEGVSVWRDDAGGTRVTLISDDNFFVLQQTVVLEYRLTEG